MIPPYQLRVPEHVRTLIRMLHPDLKRKVRAALALIILEPESGKALRKDLEGLSSFPVGKLRIIYRGSSSRTVEVIAIGPRKIIYEETLRLIRRQED
jgi:mRNA interferase RelE/StbE